MNTDQVLYFLGVLVVAAPAVLLARLGSSALIGIPQSERSIARSTEAMVVAGLIASIGILAIMLATGRREIPLVLGDWFVIKDEHLHFSLKFVFDRLSVPFVILTFVLVGTIGAFANRYLHREVGYNRFFLLYAFFLLGMIVAFLAGTIETLFLGWELVGLSSALLVAYFQERPSPVRNGQRVWSVYRVADAAFLAAAVALHHATGEGDFLTLMGTGPWPEGTASLSSGQALYVGLLLLVAAAGKSALIPFSGWLPRAMEGPTPSSAVFYGALSVHLGTYLLLRVSPILALSFTLSAIVVALGLASAVFGGMAARVQTDVKSGLAFASLTQVGIITAEIGLGFHYLALIHMIGHACLRALQLLRAPSLLRDYHRLENAIGERLQQQQLWRDRIPPSVYKWLYRMAFERGWLDAGIDELFVRPFVRVFRWCDQAESQWTDWLCGEDQSPDAPVTRHVQSTGHEPDSVAAAELIGTKELRHE